MLLYKICIVHVHYMQASFADTPRNQKVLLKARRAYTDGIASQEARASVLRRGEYPERLRAR